MTHAPDSISSTSLGAVGQPSIWPFDVAKLLVVASLLIPALVFALAAWQGHGVAMHEAELRVERTARILHEHAIKVFETQNLVIDQVNGRLRFIDWSNDADRFDLHKLLAHLQDDLEQVTTITVTDADGRARASGRAFPIDSNISFADRDWFQALKTADRSPAYISRSYVGRQSGQSVFNVAGRALTSAARAAPGAFDGAVAISINRSYFENFYSSLEPDFAHAIELLREDGQILARQPALGADAVPPSAAEMTMIREESKSGRVIRSSVNGAERLSSYRQVNRYPMIVGFSIDVNAALAPWRNNLLSYGFVAFLASALLLALSVLANARARREHTATLGWKAALTDLRGEMIERGRVEDQLRQAQKMEAVGRLTGGVAHDFNNLLTVVIGSLDLLKQRLANGDPRHLKLVTNAIHGANRAAALTAQLLAFSRQQPLAPEPIDANRHVAGMSDVLTRTLGENIAIETVLAGGLWPTLADPNQLESAILNLAVNARDAMPDGGRLTIETANTHLDEAYASVRAEVAVGQYVMVAVSDTGAGMTPETISRAFEPFYTTKAVGKGTGLGLSQIYGYAKQSGGHVAIYSEAGHGTTIKLYLPRLNQAHLSAIPAATNIPDAPILASAGLGETILVVEDEAMVRDLSTSILREAGYLVLEAADGESGLALLQTHPEIDLLFTDVVLTGAMNGRHLANAAANMRPQLPILFTTGYTKNAIIHHGRLDDGVNLIGKPFTPDMLRSRIRGLIDASLARADG